MGADYCCELGLGGDVLREMPVCGAFVSRVWVLFTRQLIWHFLEFVFLSEVYVCALGVWDASSVCRNRVSLAEK